MCFIKRKINGVEWLASPNGICGNTASVLLGNNSSNKNSRVCKYLPVKIHKQGDVLMIMKFVLPVLV